MNEIIFKILRKFKLIREPDYNSIEYLRSRGVQIGENVHLYNSNIDFGHGFLVSIGNNVTITGSTLLAHDASTQIPLNVSKVGRINIGNNVFIGHGSIVLPDVTIGNNCIIGAGSVVSKNIPANSVAVGNPIRVISTYDDYVNKHSKNMKNRPIYSTHWKQKTENEKLKMREDLITGIGYDL